MRLKKPLKILGIAIGSVIALLIVLVIALIVLIDPNKYRDQIVSAVKTHTGRNLTIEGDLKLSVFPWIGLETGGLQLSNAPGFGNEPFARVDSAAVKVELLPLLRKQVRVDGVRLNGLKLHLARAANGRTNWDDLAGKKKPDTAPEPKPSETADPGAALAAFTINRIEVTNSEFTWRDQTSGANYAVRRVNVKSGNLLSSSPVPLSLAFDFESGQPKVAKRVQLDARLNLNPSTETLDVPELNLALGDLHVQGQVRGTDMFGTPKFAGRLEIPAFAPRALLKELGVAYVPADAKALNKLALTARFEHNAQATSLPELRITLDDTQITGNLALQSQPRTGYRGDLAIDAIDIDRYLPAASAADNKAAEKPAAAAAPVVIPLALLRDTNANAQLRIQQLKAFGIRSQQVVVKVNAANGRITLGPNTANLYNGTYAGRTVADVSGKTPKFEFDEKLNNINIGPFLKDAGVFERYSGTGNVNLAMTAQGFDAAQIKRSLNGNVAAQLRDGKIQGVNLQKLIQDARSLYDKARSKDTRPPVQASDETAFSSLTATIKITNGLARNDDLKLEGPVMRATGNGTANLVDETVDYRLQATLAEGTDRAGTTVPVTITGTFQKPSFGVDVSALFREQVQQKIEKKLDERLDKFRQKLKR